MLTGVPILTLTMVFLTVLFIVALIFLFKKLRGLEQPKENTSLQLLQNQLHQIMGQVNAQLKENATVVQQTHQSLGERLDTASQGYSTVMNKLIQLEESNKRIYEVGKDLATLQEILRAPKLRGTLGELFLSQLISQILPPEHYMLQHQFKNGQTVDAVIVLRDNYLVPIDAKFPLENFKKMLEVENKEENERLRKTFISDVKKHLDKIAELYILPDEKTLDFALMYIPAENIYYEIIIKNYEGRGDLSLIDYAFSKKVIPVSPNTFYIYLQAILIGLRGLQIEKGAQEILNNLTKLRGDFTKFNADFELLGTHLTRAKNSYDDSTKRLEKFDSKLSLTTGAKEIRPAKKQ